MEKGYQQRTLYDFFGEFSAGVNSGVQPLLLQKNQLAFATNCTVRGAFVSHRPARRKIAFDFGGSSALQNLVENGRFQGGGYYRPDFGTESVIAAISGHLIKFTESGNAWTVTDISIASDLNDVNAPQVWMWQSEKWLIVQDGTGKLPLIYDGETIRRSFGESSLIGTIGSNFTPPNPRVIGEVVTLTLSENYSGQFNVPVLFNGEYYQPTASSGFYLASIKNLNGTAGTPVSSGEDVVVIPVLAGTTSGIASPTNGTDMAVTQLNLTGTILYYDSFFFLTGNGPNFQTVSSTIPFLISAGTEVEVSISQPFSGGVGSILTIPLSQTFTERKIITDSAGLDTTTGAGDFETTISIGSAWDVLQITNAARTKLRLKLRIAVDGKKAYTWQSLVQRYASPAGRERITYSTFLNQQPILIAAGSQISYASGSSPSVVIANVFESFLIPAINSSITIKINAPYSGASGQNVSIIGKNFQITSVAASVGVSLNLINLSDTSTAIVVVGTADADILSVPELPAGRMGAYGMGRNWMSLTDGISYIGGDIVGGGAGTPANNYRDSVLKTTENTFLSGGGAFRLPGSGNIITAMIFTANLDTALGQGPLQVGTPESFFSVNTPIDRAEWVLVTNPIQTESLIGSGSTGQNSTTLANSDVIFRSLDGLGSLILARRDFGTANTGGNTPISREMDTTFRADNKSLLPFGSSIIFDNRLLITASPQSQGNGIAHGQLVALNYDPLSSMRSKLPAVYDGVWDGLNVLQVVTGAVGGVKRAFAFASQNSVIELHEFLSDPSAHFDNTSERISWSFETPILFGSDVKTVTELVKLRDGEIYIQDVDGAVDIVVQYRPDFAQTWTDWRTINVPPGSGDYKMRLGLGEPTTADCKDATGRPSRIGYFFQLKVSVTGHCKFMGARLSAATEPQPTFAQVNC